MLRRISLLSLIFVIGAAFGVGATVGLGAGMLGSAIFSDVPSGAYYDSAVGDLYSRGIIKGYDDGKFHPDDAVTRGQIAVMFQRFINGGAVPGSSSSRSSRSSSDATSSSTVSSSQSSSSSQASAGPAGGFQFTKSSYQIAESSGTFDGVVIRAKGSKGAVTVKYRITGISATAADDFTANAGTLSFADGETTKAFSTTIVDDKVGEINEVIQLTLEDPTGGAVLLNPNTATITILDNDGGCTVNCPVSSSSSSSSVAAPGPANTFVFTASAYALYEGAQITVTVQRTGATTSAATVNFAAANGTAQAGTDYTVTSGTLSFAAGETTKTFTVNASDNSAIDGNRNFTVSLSSPTGGPVLGTPASATVSVIDNETAATGSGSFKFSSSSFVALENDTYAIITVQRTGPMMKTVSVQYATSNGQAGPDDYITAAGTLTFAPGETSKTFIVGIKDDVVSEGTETVNLQLSNAVGATISNSSAVLNISD